MTRPLPAFLKYCAVISWLGHMLDEVSLVAHASGCYS